MFSLLLIYVYNSYACHIYVCACLLINGIRKLNKIEYNINVNKLNIISIFTWILWKISGGFCKIK